MLVILHLMHGAPTQGWQYQNIRRDKTKIKLKYYFLVLLCSKTQNYSIENKEDLNFY